VFPGNTVDVSTVEQVKADLKGWQLSRCLFVGDAGMVSQANLKMLSRGGGKYIVCMPMRRGDEVTEEVLARPGRYRAVADNLRVKEVVIGDGERRRRYIVCHNPRGKPSESGSIAPRFSLSSRRSSRAYTSDRAPVRANGLVGCSTVRACGALLEAQRHRPSGARPRQGQGRGAPGR
jgi:hypothetical protein